jgi:hypothetical protein
MRSERSGQTLAASLVVILIIGILAVVMLKGSGAFGGGKSSRADGRGTTVPGLVKAKAEDTVCRNYLGQLRLSIGIAKMDNDDQWPATLQDTRLGETYYTCPMGKGNNPYQYTPATGEVKCTYPGHEKY